MSRLEDEFHEKYPGPISMRTLFEIDFSESENLRDQVFQELEKLIPKCESEIEVLFLKTWIEEQNRCGYAIDLLAKAASIQVQHEAYGYRGDFVFPEAKIWVEIDGHDFHKNKWQRGNDAARDRDLLIRGWKVFRFTGSKVYKNPVDCCTEVEDELFGRNAFNRAIGDL